MGDIKKTGQLVPFWCFSGRRNSLDSKAIDELHLPRMGTRWRIEFETRKPSNPDQETWTVGIAPSLLEVLQKSGHTVKQARILLIKRRFSKTFGRFIKVRSRPAMDGCFVYVGSPAHDYRGPTITSPAPPRMVFLVFVLPDGTIDDWNWRRTRDDDPTIPAGIDGRRIWPQT